MVPNGERIRQMSPNERPSRETGVQEYQQETQKLTESMEETAETMRLLTERMASCADRMAACEDISEQLVTARNQPSSVSVPEQTTLVADD